MSSDRLMHKQQCAIYLKIMTPEYLSIRMKLLNRRLNHRENANEYISNATLMMQDNDGT